MDRNSDRLIVRQSQNVILSSSSSMLAWHAKIWEQLLLSVQFLFATICIEDGQDKKLYWHRKLTPPRDIQYTCNMQIGIANIVEIFCSFFLLKKSSSSNNNKGGGPSSAWNAFCCYTAVLVITDDHCH